MLVLGVTAPVEEWIENPTVEPKVPPVKAPVPLKLTDCAVLNEIQNGEPAKIIVAVGTAVMVTAVVAVTTPQPPDAAIV